MNLITQKELPAITVITPNYNYGEHLEATIHSVLSQGYPKLRYVVIDGGSNDNSVDIIKRHESHIHYWHSKADRGQADAINQGLGKAQGALVNWINSDDQLAEGSLFHIAEQYLSNPSGLIAASVLNRQPDHPESDEVVNQEALSVRAILQGHAVFHQPGLWWNTERIKALNSIDSKLHYCFDYLLLLRYLRRWPDVTYSSRIVAHFTLHPSSKTSTSQPSFEQERHDALCLLLKDPEFSAYHRAISRRVRSQDWHQHLHDLIAKTNASSSRKILSILQESLKDPEIRINRFTAGAIRRLLG